MTAVQVFPRGSDFHLTRSSQIIQWSQRFVVFIDRRAVYIGFGRFVCLSVCPSVCLSVCLSAAVSRERLGRLGWDSGYGLLMDRTCAWQKFNFLALTLTLLEVKSNFCSYLTNQERQESLVLTIGYLDDINIFGANLNDLGGKVKVTRSFKNGTKNENYRNL